MARGKTRYPNDVRGRKKISKAHKRLFPHKSNAYQVRSGQARPIGAEFA